MSMRQAQRNSGADKMSKVTFGRMEVWESTGAANATIFADGVDIGCIEKNVTEIGRGLAFEYRADNYSVELDGHDTRDFHVCDFETARKALAAAKAWVRAVSK